MYNRVNQPWYLHAYILHVVDTESLKQVDEMNKNKYTVAKINLLA